MGTFLPSSALASTRRDQCPSIPHGGARQFRVRRISIDVRWRYITPGSGDLTRTDLALLDGPTRARVERMARPADRARTAAAHSLLRRMLADRLDAPAHSLRLERSCPRCGSDRDLDHGRLVLPPHLGDVSLAHAGDYVVVAFATPGARIGVDVESRGLRPVDLPCLTDDAEARRAACSADPDLAALTAFTGKEAVGKALGVGLAGAGAHSPAAIDVLGARRRGDWRLVDAGAAEAQVTHWWLAPAAASPLACLAVLGRPTPHLRAVPTDAEPTDDERQI